MSCVSRVPAQYHIGGCGEVSPIPASLLKWTDWNDLTLTSPLFLVNKISDLSILNGSLKMKNHDWGLQGYIGLVIMEQFTLRKRLLRGKSWDSYLIKGWCLHVIKKLMFNFTCERGRGCGVGTVMEAGWGRELKRGKPHPRSPLMFTTQFKFAPPHSPTFPMNSFSSSVLRTSNFELSLNLSRAITGTWLNLFYTMKSLCFIHRISMTLMIY